MGVTRLPVEKTRIYTVYGEWIFTHGTNTATLRHQTSVDNYTRPWQCLVQASLTLDYAGQLLLVGELSLYLPGGILMSEAGSLLDSQNLSTKKKISYMV